MFETTDIMFEPTAIERVEYTLGYRAVYVREIDAAGHHRDWCATRSTTYNGWTPGQHQVWGWASGAPIPRGKTAYDAEPAIRRWLARECRVPARRLVRVD